jgi:protein-disulfide isomerase
VLIWLPLAQSESPAAEPGERALGDPNAPVTVIEYSSLTCPHCAQFHNEIMPELKARYIEPGKVRWVFRDFPLDQMALSASMLAHCAPPERYFGLLDVLFETQDSWRAQGLTGLTNLGRLAGMTEQQIQQCLENEELGNRILQTRLDAQEQHDVSSTPTFIIDGQSYPGSRSVEEFSRLIEPLLEES